MLAMKSYEQNEGFSVMTADEMYYVNGGSWSASTVMSAISAGAGVVAFGAATIASGASTPVTGPVGVAATVATWSGAVSAAAALTAAIAAISGN